MNSISIWLLCALLLEASVWSRRWADCVIKTCEVHGFWRHVAGGGLSALLGACACILIMQERWDYRRFRDVAIELGLKIVHEHCGPVQKVSDKTYCLKMKHGGIVVMRRFEDGREFSVGISRDPIGVFVRH